MARGRPALRDEIDASWRRSSRAGLTRDRFDVPYTSELNRELPVLRAARPVLDQLAADLATTGVSVVLADDRGQLLDRHVGDNRLRIRLDRISLAPGFIYAEHSVGTNAIGTALEQRRPAFVGGPEHFAEALIPMVCAAAPIIDPQSGRVLGAVDLSCRFADGSPLMLPLATRTAREIESRLVDQSRVADRVALQRFLRARRGAKAPMVFINAQNMITNAAAARLVAPTDEAMLWESAARALADGGGRTVAPLVLSGGTTVGIRCEPVAEGGELLGALVHLRPIEPSSGRGSHARLSRPFGWSSLTESERSVAELVSLGLTNVQVAERLFVSRYTVDSHLRATFRKLAITSRVDLTRLVIERSVDVPHGR
ncbi:MAG: putative transcriptional regulator [Ilumatobacteraceae bacterium]|nr:putative transcriptional regulator [Ilumatobacteraceae bacterium]